VCPLQTSDFDTIARKIIRKDDDSSEADGYAAPMTKTVLTFGLISGALLAGMMLATLPFIDAIGFDKGAILGYTTMVLAGLLVFFGVRSYRENVAGGRLTFGRGFTVGILISLVSCVCYVAMWEIIYFNLMPDFGDKYTAAVIAHERTSGATPQRIEELTRQTRELMKMYDNPLTNAAITLLEPLPVALVMTTLSAAILRKKKT
jgi:Protein of unknown function (DUF4199)